MVELGGLVELRLDKALVSETIHKGFLNPQTKCKLLFLLCVPNKSRRERPHRIFILPPQTEQLEKEGANKTVSVHSTFIVKFSVFTASAIVFRFQLSSAQVLHQSFRITSLVSIPDQTRSDTGCKRIGEEVTSRFFLLPAVLRVRAR